MTNSVLLTQMSTVFKLHIILGLIPLLINQNTGHMTRTKLVIPSLLFVAFVSYYLGYGFITVGISLKSSHTTDILMLSEKITLVLLNICYTNTVVISMITSSRHQTYVEQFDLLYVNGTIPVLKYGLRNVFYQTGFYVIWMCACTIISCRFSDMTSKSFIIFYSWAYGIPGLMKIYINCLGQVVAMSFVPIPVKLQELFENSDGINHKRVFNNLSKTIENLENIVASFNWTFGWQIANGILFDFAVTIDSVFGIVVSLSYFFDIYQIGIMFGFVAPVVLFNVHMLVIFNGLAEMVCYLKSILIEEGCLFAEYAILIKKCYLLGAQLLYCM